MLLATSWFLNIGAIMSDISVWIKFVLVAITALTTVMAMFNTYKTFSRNFRTLWIVVRIEEVVTKLSPKKSRHRKNSISRNKNTNEKSD